MIKEVCSEEETRKLGVDMGKKAKSGEIYCLKGNLGVGKTVFTKGFAEGLGINEHITSPTFTIVNEYSSGRIPFYHFDVYRIGDPDEMYDIGCDEYFFGEGCECFEIVISTDALFQFFAEEQRIEPRGFEGVKDLNLN